MFAAVCTRILANHFVHTCKIATEFLEAVPQGCDHCLSVANSLAWSRRCPETAGPQHALRTCPCLHQWWSVYLVECQKRGVAYPHLPYLRRGNAMLFNALVQLVIRSEVMLRDGMSRGLEVLKEHTTRCTAHSAGYNTGSTPQ